MTEGSLSTIGNRLVAMNIHYFRHSLDRFLDEAAALGLRKVELWAGMPHFYLGDINAQDITALKDKLRARGLEVICLTPEQCLYPVNLASVHPRTAERSLEYFLSAIDVCAEIECPQLLVTAGWGYADQPVDEPWARARDALGQLAARAEERGVTLLLEPLSKTESNLITTSSDLARMMEQVGSSQIAAILDQNAMAAAAETPRDYMDRFGPALRHVHLCDGTPEGHLAWGDGNLPMAGHVRELVELGFVGNFSFEFVTPAYWLDPFTPLKRSIAAFENVVTSMDNQQ